MATKNKNKNQVGTSDEQMIVGTNPHIDNAFQQTESSENHNNAAKIDLLGNHQNDDNNHANSNLHDLEDFMAVDNNKNNHGHNHKQPLSTDAFNGYYRYSIQADGLDQSTQTLGEQLVTGQLSFYDANFNVLPALNLYSVEYRVLTPAYTTPYTDDIFTNNWLTDYGQWIYKVTTNDGMKMTFTMNQVGFGAHLVSLEYQVDNKGNSVGTIPDIGTPWLVNPTIEDVETYLGIQWTPTTTTNAGGIIEQHMVYNGTTDANYLIVTKDNAIVNLGSGNDYAVGSIHNDIINGDDGTETLFGFDGNDTLYGGADTDYIYGGKGNDVINGGSGNDFIYMSTNANNYYTPETFTFAEGNDTVTGGSGADRFIFINVDLYNTNKPIAFDGGTTTITDFTIGEDKITFWNLQVLANNIVQGVNPIAQDADDYILFNTENSQLYIDPDGNGAGEAHQFATLVGIDSLTFNEFGY
jgi:Ca2+-binding RTX toxin-like protein